MEGAPWGRWKILEQDQKEATPQISYVFRQLGIHWG